MNKTLTLLFCFLSFNLIAKDHTLHRLIQDQNKAIKNSKVFNNYKIYKKLNTYDEKNEEMRLISLSSSQLFNYLNSLKFDYSNITEVKKLNNYIYNHCSKQLHQQILDYSEKEYVQLETFDEIEFFSALINSSQKFSNNQKTYRKLQKTIIHYIEDMAFSELNTIQALVSFSILSLAVEKNIFNQPLLSDIPKIKSQIDKKVEVLNKLAQKQEKSFFKCRDLGGSLRLEKRITLEIQMNLIKAVSLLKKANY